MPRFFLRQCAGPLGVLSVIGCASAAGNHNRATQVTADSALLSTVLRNHGYTAVPLIDMMQMLVPAYGVPVAFDTTGRKGKVLILDSGNSGVITLSKSAAAQFGIRGAPGRHMVGAGGGKVPMDTTHVNHLTVNGTRLDAQFVRIGGGGDMIGASFLNAHNVVVDLSKMVLYLQGVSGRGFALPRGSLEKRGYVAIPLTRAVVRNPDKTVYFLRALVNSKPVVLVLDTGGSDALYLDQRRANELGLRATSDGSVPGVAGSVAVRVGKVGHFTVGTIRMDSLQFSSMDMSKMQYDESGFPRFDGILGLGALSGRGTIIDFFHGVLYLRAK